MRHRLGLLLAALLPAFALLIVAPPAGADIVYHYDELGRLRAVIDASGESAEYVYDAVGNILQIIRRTAGTVSIIEFTPKRGPAGTTVTIFGTGYSVTPSQNAVTFNGVAATVTSASTTQLVVTVPAGATTGTIGITVTGGGSATSGEPFTVAATPVPTITSFTPTVGPVGTAVTITGTNFEILPAANRVAFAGNGALAAVGTASATSLGVTAPPGAVSGKITVQTPAGTATSAQDFFIPPGTYTTADVETTTRMTIGEVKTISIPTVNKIALVVFDATAGQRVALSTSSATILSSGVKLYAPDRSLQYAISMGTSAGFLDALTLPLTGTYTWVIDPESTYTGSITLTLHNSNDVNGTISVGGAAVTVTLGTPGQNARLTFSATANQKVSVVPSNNSIVSSDLSILKPDGTTLAGPVNVTTYYGGFIDQTTLPTTGTYTLVVDPRVANTGSMTLTLHNAADVSGPITPGGSAVPVTLTTPGQNARLTFSGTTNQRISLRVSNVSITYNYVSILKPDGTALAGPTFFGTGGIFVDTTTLPVSGTYTVFLDAYDVYTGNATLTLYDVPADASGSVTVGGSALTVTITTPGQNGAVSFSGTASQQVTVRITSNTIGLVTVSLKRASGTVLTSSVASAASFNLAQTTLPATETYTVAVDPDSFNTGSLAVQVTSP